MLIGNVGSGIMDQQTPKAPSRKRIKIQCEACGATFTDDFRTTHNRTPPPPFTKIVGKLRQHLANEGKGKGREGKRRRRKEEKKERRKKEGRKGKKEEKGERGKEKGEKGKRGKGKLGSRASDLP